jgi:FMN phosphatase YigB (HAD superfamily)
MNSAIKAVFLDSGDTLVDEATQVFDENGIVLKAGLIPGAGELMRELKRRGYRLGLVADGRTLSFRNSLLPHGIYGLFDVYAISEEVGVDKPQSAMFQKALDDLQIPPEAYGQVVMVGNHLGRDIKGANGMGLISVWLDWSPRRPKVPSDASETPRYTIHMPLDLLPLLERLERQPE